jgi:hypothetical protein
MKLEDWASDNQLDEKESLLWRAMETLRGLSGSDSPSKIAEKIEKHFGVHQTSVDGIWCTKCDNHVRKNDPCYATCSKFSESAFDSLPDDFEVN